MCSKADKFFVCCIVLMTIFETLVIQGANISPTRAKRGIWGTATSTVFKIVQEKHYVPASCLHMAPNLPDCRNVRFMHYPSFDANAFKFFSIGNELFPTSTGKAPANINITQVDRRIDEEEPTTQHIQGWGEYLGFYRPTITVTELKIEPKTVLDSRIMVTYDIRGCKPHQLPFKLERCPEESALELTEILPTTTVRADIKATSLPEKLTVAPEEVHGTEAEIEHKTFPSPTDLLPIDLEMP